MTEPNMTAPPAELPGAKPGRAAKIAAIHALADWLAEHPEIPAPDTVHCYSHADRRGTEIDDLADLRKWADANGFAEPYRGTTTAGTSLTVAAAAAHGVFISYTRSVQLDSYPEKGW
jgi:hypothetical protein